jgi:hypothetical protein
MRKKFQHCRSSPQKKARSEPFSSNPSKKKKEKGKKGEKEEKKGKAARKWNPAKGGEKKPSPKKKVQKEICVH